MSADDIFLCLFSFCLGQGKLSLPMASTKVNAECCREAVFLSDGGGDDGEGTV